MGQILENKGQLSDKNNLPVKRNGHSNDDFVLEKDIFSNVFEKDIRRVFFYKKAERLAKAVHLILPAFAGNVSLRNRLDTVAISLVDASILPPQAARDALARELLALSSLLSIARTGRLLSPMNAELISQEAHTLLQEIAAYEDPRIMLSDAPTLSHIARAAGRSESELPVPVAARRSARAAAPKRKVFLKDISEVKDIRIKDRQEGILSVIRNKGQANIKDISTVIRGVSEKTIQRELQSLVEAGIVGKKGERRWSTYFLP